MRSPAAWAIAGAFLLADLTSRLAFASGAPAVLANLLAFAIIAAAVAAVLLVGGDPLPVRAAFLIAIAAPVASALELAVMPVPFEHPSQIHLGAGAAIGGFLCARGRVAIAWTGFVAMVLVFVVWAASIGLGPVNALGFALPNLAVLLMAVAFARAVRPLAGQILSFNTAVARIRSESRAHVAHDEHRMRLDQIDEYATPLLRVIAKGQPLSPSETARCKRAEAHLREAIRAPTLSRSVVGAAAWRARERGVAVAMFDDGGMTNRDDATAQRVLGQIAATLDTVRDGSVTVRIQPLGRPLLATVLADTSGHQLRQAFDTRGEPAPWLHS
ncbi:hypothetical protein [Mycolicibacterium sp.]|uniref:hypothetical protein n=1 Tax=Mycolicibacterium sp. TaxID=2320850 RepID=UPI0037C7F5AD